jgi:hypothetical protein
MNKKTGMPRQALILLAALMIVSCGKPAAEAGRAAAEESPPTAAAGNGGMPFELVSIERVDAQRSNSAAGNTVYWDQDGEDNGVLIVLKLKEPESLEYYSSDFSLGYEDEAGIPRSACVGISMGVTGVDLVKLSSWMLAGAMSRSWASAEKPYFGVLFGVPRKVGRVTLYYASPLLKDLDLPAAGPTGESR